LNLFPAAAIGGGTVHQSEKEQERFRSQRAPGTMEKSLADNSDDCLKISTWAYYPLGGMAKTGLGFNFARPVATSEIASAPNSCRLDSGPLFRIK